MRWGDAVSATRQTGQSDEIHSPDAWARIVAGLGIDRGRLHRRYLMPAKAFTHEIKPAREGGIAEDTVARRGHAREGASERLLGIRELELGLGERRRYGADRFARALHSHPPRLSKLIAPDFE